MDQFGVYKPNITPLSIHRYVFDQCFKNLYKQYEEEGFMDRMNNCLFQSHQVFRQVNENQKENVEYIPVEDLITDIEYTDKALEDFPKLYDESILPERYGDDEDDDDEDDDED